MEQVVIVKEAPQAPEGHDQAMIDKVDQAQQRVQQEISESLPDKPQPQQERPQWLPEKFKSPEDLAKAYAELESKLGKPQAPQETPKEEPAALSIQTEEQAKATLSEKGLDFQKFSVEFAANGGLSEASYQELQGAGIPKNVVDSYITGIQAQADQYRSTVTAEVGGQEQYDTIVSWAAANLAPEDISAYNAAMSSGSLAQARLAAAGLALKYTQANGSPPKVVLGGNTTSVSSDVFESTAQVRQAMSDPRYKQDPAYRRTVMEKLGRSNVF